MRFTLLLLSLALLFVCALSALAPTVHASDTDPASWNLFVPAVAAAEAPVDFHLFRPAEITAKPAQTVKADVPAPIQVPHQEWRQVCHGRYCTYQLVWVQ